MAGRKRTAKRTLLECSTKTGKTMDPDTDSNDEQSIPRSSKQMKTHVNQSWTDSNNELLKQNPFLIPNVLACLCGNSSTEALFKYRLVGQHIWNELAVNAINQDNSSGVRLVKLFDPNEKGINSTRTVEVISFKELISTLHGGRLEKSTLTRIYLNNSLTDNDLKEFLQLNGQNIQSLHYEGRSLEDLRQILKTCAKKLMSLSLWSSWNKKTDRDKGLFNNHDDEFKFPRLESLSIASGELNIYLGGIENNICNPSKEFLSHVFRASPNLKSLSARFYDSFLLDSGLSFKNLTTLCIKFKIRISQLRALCDVGLKLKKLRLQGLFIAPIRGGNNRYMDDPEWMEFRKLLLIFIQTQANTLEYFAVSLYWEIIFCARGHNSTHEQWSTMTGFPRIPNLHTFIFYECSGKIPKEEFCYLFPKLRNLELVKCNYRQAAGLQQHNILEYPLRIPISKNPSISVRSIRGIQPTMELAQIFPAVTEFYIEGKIPHKLPIYWPKLKHLYYKDSCNDEDQSDVVAYIREMSKFLVGISPAQSEWIERNINRSDFDIAKLELPRSQPSIFDLNELETFEFKFISYAFETPLDSPGIASALEVLITHGLSKLTHLKKLNFVLEQKPRPSRYFTLPQKSLDGFANNFWNRKDLTISTNCDEFGKYPRNHTTKKWTLKMNLNHHKSEWKEIDRLFCEDPDICNLGLSVWIDDEEGDEDGF